ncbi:MAG: zf-HC2 domain-containing protein [Oligoflexia bacterium]|nr:zf-HC2 domain-containing protein [Oligoflexia bacterium]
MISCQRATELISKRMEEPLSLKEELSLKLHLFICEFCEKFAQQVHLVRSAIKNGSTEPDDSDTHASAEAKERLKDKLKLRS